MLEALSLTGRGPAFAASARAAAARPGPAATASRPWRSSRRCAPIRKKSINGLKPRQNIPTPSKLTPAHKKELEALRREQAEVAELLHKITPADEGGQP